jgi:glycosyl transferase family 92
MNAESDRLWERFLEYAALARAKPAFDIEEREWKLEVADRMQEALRAAVDGKEWLAPLSAVYKKVGFSRYAPAWAHQGWLDRLSAANSESLRQALAAFLDTDAEAEGRFRSFARTLEEAATGANGTVEMTPAVTVGSVCNFAVEPLSLPMMRPGIFGVLERMLGYRQPGSESLSDTYSTHLAFARRLRSRMEESGFPIRDMIDVQSLIFIAVHERGFWQGERLHAIGPSPPARRREAQDGQRRAASRPYLSICAGYRNEAPYLQEWIEFHRLAGVEHFFLYDAHSTDAHEAVLAPYVEDGIVTTHDWEGISHNQADTYNECLRAHRDESRWIAFIDCDEFLFSPTGRTLPETLAEFEPWPAVGVNWALFGRSGHVTKPTGLVIENYLMRSDTPINMFVKCIVDPSHVTRCRNAHEFIYDSLLAVDENHYPIHGYFTKSLSFSRLRINHYVTKSDEEARAKLGRPTEWNDSRTWRATMIEDNFPQERDETITRYVPAVRTALAARSAPVSPSEPAQPT